MSYLVLGLGLELAKSRSLAFPPPLATSPCLENRFLTPFQRRDMAFSGDCSRGESALLNSDDSTCWLLSQGGLPTNFPRLLNGFLALLRQSDVTCASALLPFQRGAQVPQRQFRVMIGWLAEMTAVLQTGKGESQKGERTYLTLQCHPPGEQT